MLSEKRTPLRQHGFTLAEVLVTLAIFAFGMLGVAGMQLTSLGSMDSAQHRSVATLKASELAERMRANPGAGYAGLEAEDHACHTAHFSKRNEPPAVCTAAEMAADDLQDWSEELAGSLPQGQGTVCIDSTPQDGTPAAPACDGSGSVIAIKVWWTERPKSAAPAAPKLLTMSMVEK
jgi:type IV pilus assembly protein PilV